MLSVIEYLELNGSKKRDSINTQAYKEGNENCIGKVVMTLFFLFIFIVSWKCLDFRDNSMFWSIYFYKVFEFYMLAWVKGVSGVYRSGCWHY